MAIDRGLTHLALPVTDLEASLDFYARYAHMQVVHRRRDPESGTQVAWISDLTRPFVLVLIEADHFDHRLGGPYCHLGVGVADRAEVDRLTAAGRSEGRSVLGPLDDGPPVGYWACISDPDGHTLEISYGQEVGLAVESHAADAPLGDAPHAT